MTDNEKLRNKMNGVLCNSIYGIPANSLDNNNNNNNNEYAKYKSTIARYNVFYIKKSIGEEINYIDTDIVND